MSGLLKVSLALAVPLWIEKLRARPVEELLAQAPKLSQIIAEKGDVLQFKGKGTADAFNALAKGLAILAFAPGGVTFLGMHFEEKHPDGAKGGTHGRST